MVAILVNIDFRTFLDIFSLVTQKPLRFSEFSLFHVKINGSWSRIITEMYATLSCCLLNFALLGRFFNISAPLYSVLQMTQKLLKFP